MRRITFFTKPDCSLCRSALYVVRRVQRAIPFDLEIVDVSAAQHAAWFEKYRHDIPVVHLDGAEVFRHRIEERRLRELLESGGPGDR